MARSDLNYIEGGGKEVLRRINVPTPNKDLAEWFLGPEWGAIVEDITNRIYTGYFNTAPVRQPRPNEPANWPPPGNLRRGIYQVVRPGGPKGDRLYGYVGNRALSYRPQRGQLYPRFVEYGKPTRNIEGRYDLQRAAQEVYQQLMGGGVSLPGITPAPSGRGSKLRSATTGRFVGDQLSRASRPRRSRRKKTK